MDVDKIIREVLKVVDQEGTKIDEIVARTLKERTIECDSIIEEYLQKGDVKKAMVVYTKVAGMYNQIADKIQDEKYRKILRMMADFWIQSRDIESEFLESNTDYELGQPKLEEYVGDNEYKPL